jgi:hypothetical protein
MERVFTNVPLPGMSMASTPLALNGGYSGKARALTRQFCKKINDETAIYLPYTDVGGAKGLCHDNIKALVEQAGGSAQFGWLIWQDHNHALDAEFHCVWRSPAGDLVDVSPRLDDCKFVLFLPDPVRRFDFDTMTTYCNRSWYPKEARYFFVDFTGKRTKSETCSLLDPATMDVMTALAREDTVIVQAGS